MDDLDLGPGAGLTDAGYNSHLPSGPTAAKVDSPALAGLPREDGAGDESEGSGLTAPPAPPGNHGVGGESVGGVIIIYPASLWEYHAQNPDLAGGVIQLPRAPRGIDLALARCDAFMVAMRADHARWMSGARERWAAA